MLTALWTGLLATVLATAQVIAFAATGLLFVPDDAEDELALPSAILIGSGIAAFLLAVGTYFGLTDSLLAGVVTAWAVAVAYKWLALRTRLLRLAARLRPVFRSRVVSASVSAAAGLFWIDAIVPPRDADVMCYHLAHIRQILLDGSWVPQSDYYYALPFGWTLTFLPFERLGIPEAAHVLTLIVWLITVSALASWLLKETRNVDSLAIIAIVALQPGLVKMVTTAHADGYAMLVTVVVTFLVARGPALSQTDAAILGFASWIGIQSRYQLAAVGIVATMFFVLQAIRGQISRPVFFAGLGGATAALLLASPFYVVNALELHNPVWPMLIPQINGLSGYGDRIADAFNHRLVGSHSFSTLVGILPLVLRDPLVFPLPILALVLASSVVWAQATTTRRLATFSLAFFAVWYGAQPSLYPRFVLLLVPMVMLGLGIEWAAFLARARATRGARAAAIAGIALCCTGFAAVDVWYAKDAAVYVISGDIERYHTATWYHSVYRFVNDSTPSNARLMVIVQPPEQTYYLRRSYRRADPETTGLIDWKRIASVDLLMQEMTSLNLGYILYEHRKWALNGGPGMTNVIMDAVENGKLRLVKSFDVKLVTRRITGEATRANVWLLQRVAAE